MVKKAKAKAKTTKGNMRKLTYNLSEEHFELVTSAFAAARKHFGVTSDDDAVGELITWFGEHPPSNERKTAVADALNIESADTQDDRFTVMMTHFLWEITGKTLHAGVVS